MTAKHPTHRVERARIEEERKVRELKEAKEREEEEKRKEEETKLPLPTAETGETKPNDVTANSQHGESY